MKTMIFKISALALALGLTAGIAGADTIDTASTPDNDISAVQVQDRLQDQSRENAQQGNGMQHRQQMQGRMGQGEGHPELVSPEERAEFRNQMQSAQSMEERQALRETMHETVTERAKEAGIELPERAGKGMGMRGERPDHGEMGMRGERPDHGNMDMRGERPDRPEMGAHGERPERGDMGLRAERPERGDVGARVERPERASSAERGPRH